MLYWYKSTNTEQYTYCAGPQVGRLSHKRRRLQLLSSVTCFTGTNVQILTRCAGPQVGRLSDKRRRLQLKITHVRAAWAARASVVTWAVTASCPRPVASSAQAPLFTFAFYVLLYAFYGCDTRDCVQLITYNNSTHTAHTQLHAILLYTYCMYIPILRVQIRIPVPSLPLRLCVCARARVGSERSAHAVYYYCICVPNTTRILHVYTNTI